MEAGRELDGLIAEKVMGCKVKRSDVTRFVYCDCGDNRHGEPEIGLVLDYSRDIAAAWQVVEKLQSMGYWMELDTQKPISCAFHGEDNGGYQESDTASLAICLAALKVVGVEVSNA